MDTIYAYQKPGVYSTEAIQSCPHDCDYRVVGFIFRTKDPHNHNGVLSSLLRLILLSTLVFLPRDSMLARHMPWPCVRPCPLESSQVGVLSKRRQIESSPINSITSNCSGWQLVLYSCAAVDKILTNTARSRASHAAWPAGSSVGIIASFCHGLRSAIPPSTLLFAYNERKRASSGCVACLKNQPTTARWFNFRHWASFSWKIKGNLPAKLGWD